MNYLRAWSVLATVWAATALLIAPIVADAVWDDSVMSVGFFWLLLVGAALVPLVHEFIHPQRLFRRVILLISALLAVAIAYSLDSGWRTSDLLWVPLVWTGILGLSDFLFTKARRMSVVSPQQTEAVKARLRTYATTNAALAVEGFEANASELKKVFLDELPQEGGYSQVGGVSLAAAKDFLATKFGFEAALAAFLIVFMRVYDDPRQAEAYTRIWQYLSRKLSQVSKPGQNEQLSYLSEADAQKVWRLVNDPRHTDKMDELRLAAAMAGLLVGTHLKPLLSRDADRETLMRLVKRSLNRMRACLQA